MYIATIPNRNSPPAAILLRESYREKGKIKSRALANLSSIRATTGGRPYKNHDSIDVTGHNDEFIDFNTRIIFGNFIPYGLNHAPGIIQHHFPSLDFSEQTFPAILLRMMCS